MSTFTVPIVTVKTVTKHPNADALDILTFEEVGWQCVDKRGIRNPGDLVVYVPIDSVVDTKQPEFAFLASKGKANYTYRIRTIRLRGEISQGLVVDFPDVFKMTPETAALLPQADGELPGADMAAFFGIKKYEPPAEHISPMMAGNFPGWCEKSDAERYQNFNRSIEPYIDELFYKSLKMDGSSMTVFYEDGRIGVCSRNWEVKEEDEGANKWVGEAERPKATNIYWSVARAAGLLTKVEDLARKYGYKHFAVQGEVCGPGVQGNKMGLDKLTFFAFDIYDGEYYHDFLQYADFLRLTEEALIRTVPIIECAPIRGEVESNFKRVNALCYPNDTPAEGVVYVAANCRRVGTLGRLKFKFINPEFLLKYE
jgi:RNA ligase (TIGR02306 family)